MVQLFFFQDLWKYKAQQDPPLLEAIGEDDSLTVKYLLDHGADPNSHMAKGMSALEVAGLEGSTANMKLLLEHGAQLDARDDYNNNALIVASQYDRLDVVQFLISRGIPLDVVATDGGTALGVAAYEGERKIVSELLRAGVPVAPPPGARSAIELAKQKGYEEIVKLLENWKN